MEYPPDFKPYSLKSRSFTPTFDTSIHNVQGINVWANKAPKPFGQSNTLPRKTNFNESESHLPTSSYLVNQGCTTQITWRVNYLFFYVQGLNLINFSKGVSIKKESQMKKKLASWARFEASAGLIWPADNVKQAKIKNTL